MEFCKGHLNASAFYVYLCNKVLVLFISINVLLYCYLFVSNIIFNYIYSPRSHYVMEDPNVIQNQVAEKTLTTFIF